ncbi:MAG TPA: peptidase C14 [Elusimicrobia bacterium]|nr:peptidase C14 [Elusimicrobiota bacterium]
MRQWCSSVPAILIAAVLSGCATPLQKAIIRGDDEAVRRIIGAGADVEGLGWGTDKQESPLYTAAVTDNLRAAQLLVAKGAKVDRILSYGRHPLKQAAFWGYTDMVSFLLGAGADPEAGGPETALVLAACVPGNRVSNPIDKGIMKLLLEKGADPNRSGNLIVRIGDTPLACAARKGDAAAVRLLLKHGAEVDPAALDQAAGPVKRLLEEALAAAQGPTAPAAPSVPSAAAEASAKALGTSDIDKPGFRLAERPEDYAVVVGIGKYSDIPEARFAERDAEAVRDHLIAAGFPSRNVVHLAGEKAGYKSLEKYVEAWLPNNASRAGRVFFYFSGHGAPDPKTGEAYLIPWDGDPDYLERTGYPIKRLYEKLSALKAKEVIVAMDACFSGAGGRSVLAKGARPLVMKVDAGTAPQNLTVFAATSGSQITSALEDQGHGTFTYYFLKGLSGAAKDGSGAVTAKGLYDYLKPKVQDAARRQNRDQEPVLHGSGDKELVRF